MKFIVSYLIAATTYGLFDEVLRIDNDHMNTISKLYYLLYSKHHSDCNNVPRLYFNLKQKQFYIIHKMNETDHS